MPPHEHADRTPLYMLVNMLGCPEPEAQPANVTVLYLQSGHCTAYGASFTQSEELDKWLLLRSERKARDLCLTEACSLAIVMPVIPEPALTGGEFPSRHDNADAIRCRAS